MKEKRIVSVLITVVAVLIIGAGFLYNFLAKNNGGSNLVPAPSQNESSEGEKTEDDRIKIPDFTIIDNSGSEVKFSSFEGKPVVLNFWATWCGFCKQEMPDFQDVYNEKGEEIHFLMLNATDGSRETVEKAKAYIEKEGFTFPVYFDEKLEGTKTFGVNGLPRTIFIDSEGYLVGIANGVLDKDTILEGIGLIEEKEKTE